MRYTRRNHVTRTEGTKQPVLRLLLNDGARQPRRGRVRALVDIGDDEAGGFAHTRQNGNLARVALLDAERTGHARQDALCDAEVKQQVMRGGAPLCDSFQNASLVLRLPQRAECRKCLPDRRLYHVAALGQIGFACFHMQPSLLWGLPYYMCRQGRVAPNFAKVHNL